MADDATVVAIPHAIDCVARGAGPVAGTVALVVLQRIVADVEKPAGLQEAVQFCDQRGLTVVVRNAGEDGENGHRIEGAVRFGDGCGLDMAKRQARIRAPAARDHLG